MDFFESQDRARRKTGQLVFLFVLATLSLILLTNAVLAFFGGGFDFEQGRLGGIDWEVHAFLSLAIIGVIFVASLYKIAKLSGGGKVVATSLGGRLLNRESGDYHEQRLLNVVEEMAIAAGLPVPPVYVLDDDAINAFAAGYEPDDAVIGVTRGAVRYLNREELQGVIAHEFSHILHGDMRINIRLIGVLFGILAIGTIGYYIMRSSSFRSARSDRDGAPLILIGLGLVILGYAGTFFGNLIKASVSRQREFLADASAVQYTRNPDGIAGALKKIGGFRYGSRLLTPAAAEASHLFIGQALKLSSLMATHPPLEDRIRRLQPAWDGGFTDIEAEFRQQQKSAHTEFAQVSSLDSGAPAPAAAATSATVLESVGEIAPAHIDYAHDLLVHLRGDVRAAIQRPNGARAAIYALLLSEDHSQCQQQLEIIRARENENFCDDVEDLLPKIRELGVEYRIPIIDLCLPVLKRQYSDQIRRFQQTVLELMRADDQIDLFEWCLHRLFLRHLGNTRGDSLRDRRARRAPVYESVQQLESECREILSALARRSENVEQAYNSALDELGFSAAPPVERSLSAIDDALNKLCDLAPLQKPRFIKACARCALADNLVNAEEFELLRAVADSMDVPLPPRLEAQAVI